MTNQDEISAHYQHGELLNAILSGIEQLGKSQANVTIEDLAIVDEFHIGGRKASEDFFNQLDITPDQHFLDVGCGLGGVSRFVAQKYKCHVSGIDLSAEYIETGKTLSSWLGLEEQVDLHQGSALATGFDNDSFDGAYMMHVGMNIKDKPALFEEVFRCLRPGSLFAIFDVMQTGEGELDFPVPWATESTSSAVTTINNYKSALENVGFVIEAERNRRDFAIEFFEQLRAKTASSKGRPALGLHILMG
ncbi:MAG: methyltransferase domain-containing protein, partial [Gammaproteobacteria bacterium]|nr:methyltransferase domain-containing protein [Gammaproteobacteria bacterium]